MKRLLILLVCLLLFSLVACTSEGKIEVVKDADKKPAEQIQDSDNKEPMPTPSQEPVHTESVVDDLSTAAPAPTITPTAPPTPSMAPGPRMYPSYAHMVSYDPATGIAEFDYFDILTGHDAIKWMVDHEGYTVTEATDIVDDWGDGEYWYKNTNPQLRTIDLDDQGLILMFQPDGTQATGAEGIPSNTVDANALYALDPNYLFERFFFYIHVDADGHVTLVEQVYWC